MKKNVKEVPTPQEREEEHEKDMKDLRKQIDHSKQKEKQLLLDDKEEGGPK